MMQSESQNIANAFYKAVFVESLGRGTKNNVGGSGGNDRYTSTHY